MLRGEDFLLGFFCGNLHVDMLPMNPRFSLGYKKLGVSHRLVIGVGSNNLALMGLFFSQKKENLNIPKHAISYGGSNLITQF